MRDGWGWLCKCLGEGQSSRNSMGKDPGAGVAEKAGRAAWLDSWLEQREESREPGFSRRVGRKVEPIHTSTSLLMRAGSALTHTYIPRVQM